MNRFSKALLALLLVASLLAAIPAFAVPSSPGVAGRIVRADIEETTYNRQVQTPVITVYDENDNEVDAAHYSVDITGTPKNVKSKGYPVTISGILPWTGTVEGIFWIRKAINNFRITADKYSFKYSATRDQTTKLHPAAVKGGAHLVFRSSSRNVVVDGPNRKVTIKKGFKGSATITCTAQETTNYKRTSRTIKITVK